MATLGSILLQNGRTKVAVTLFQEALRIAPQNAWFVYTLGAALAKAGDTTAAMRQFRRSITLDPAALQPYLALAELYTALGNTALRRQVLDEYLRRMPQSITFQLRRAAP